MIWWAPGSRAGRRQSQRRGSRSPDAPIRQMPRGQPFGVTGWRVRLILRAGPVMRHSRAARSAGQGHQRRGHRYRSKRFAALATEMDLTGPGRPEKTAGRSGCRITNEPPAAHADVISAIDSSPLPFLPDGPGDTATPARSAITATSASCPTARKSEPRAWCRRRCAARCRARPGTAGRRPAGLSQDLDEQGTSVAGGRLERPRSLGGGERSGPPSDTNTCL